MYEQDSTTPSVINDKSDSHDKRLWLEHLEELKKRAITAEYAAKVGLFSFDLEGYAETRKKYRLPSQWPGLPGYRTTGIAIEYPKALDGIPRIRIRSDKTSVFSEDGTKETKIPRYVCQANPVSVVPYFTPEALGAAANTSVPLYIVEAPLKAISLACNGFPAIGLGGVSAGAHDAEEKRILGEVTASKEMRRINWKGRKVYVVFDAGIADNPQVAHGAAVVWKALSDLGADVWIVTIPFRHPTETDLEKGEFFAPTDQGPDDFLAKEGVEAFQARVDAAIPLDPEKMAKHLAGRSDELKEATRSLHFQACLALGKKEGSATMIADVAAQLPKGSYGKRELAKLADGFTSRLAVRAKEDDKDSADIWERGDEAECASRLISHFSKKGPIVADGGELYRYQDGRYAEIESAELITTSAKWAGQPMADGSVLKVRHSWQLGGVKIASAMATKLGEKNGFFGGAPNAVGFRNGVLVVEDGQLIRNEDGTPKLHDHSPTWRLRAVYDFDYVPGLRPEKILAASKDLPAEGMKDLQCWGEHAGACLFGLATSFSRGIMLLGAGGSGKSKIQELTEKAFPQDVVSTIAPQSLDAPYNRARLVGRRINIVADMPEKAFLDTGPLKAVISGDRIEARNLYEDPFDVKPIAGWLISANRLPPHNDNTNGFRRRWIILYFPKILDKGDKFYVQKMLPEIPALVSWFVDCLCTLLDRGDYDIPETSERLVSEWIKDGSQIEQFADECLTLIEGSERDSATPKDMQSTWTSAKLAFEEYVRWAEQTRHKPMSMTSFGREMKAFLRCDTAKTEHGVYYPVRLRAAAADEISEEELEKLLGEKAAPKKDDAPISGDRKIETPDPSEWAPIREEGEGVEIAWTDGDTGRYPITLAQLRDRIEVRDFEGIPHARRRRAS